MKSARHIEANLRTYLGQRTPTARYTSFDYCYNHFQRHRERGALHELVVGPNLQLSCLHLAFYLASWGMLRASSALLQRSVKHYVPVIEIIASSPAAIWNVDADCYTEANCGLVLETAQQIRGGFARPRIPHCGHEDPARCIRLRSGLRQAPGGGLEARGF